MARRLIKLARGPIVHDSIMMHLYSKNKQVYLPVHVYLRTSYNLTKQEISAMY